MFNFEFLLEKMQGELFKMSSEKGYDSLWFVKSFMGSELAEGLDRAYSKYQYMDEEYWFEEMLDSFGNSLIKSDRRYPPEEMFWIGYIYRSWHNKTGESSKEIYRKAKLPLMDKIYTTEWYNDCDSVLEYIGVYLQSS